MAQAPEAGGNAGQKVEELKVSAHLMTLDRGLFCVFHAPGSQQVDPATGLPGVRVTLPPDQISDVTIRTFREDGWISGDEGAALVKVPSETARVLITIYQRPGATEPPPKIQIQQLSEGGAAGARGPNGVVAPGTAVPANAEVAAHVQRRGDVVTQLGEWMGERGSQRWIEGFSLAPQGGGGGGGGSGGGSVRKEDVEYQAVLGRGWLSPWADGGQYCGSRGMALPILGLRVRLKGEAALTHSVRVSATFTDGTAVGPIDGSRACEAESLAPLEAFLVEIVPAPAAALPEAAPGRGAPAAARPRVPLKPPARPAPTKPFGGAAKRK